MSYKLTTQFKSSLLSKHWFGFDLDDTLHEFRKASHHASQSVFEAINTSEGISIDTLRMTYQDILRTSTANAFTDGRTSKEYRRERFTRLLQAHGAMNDSNVSPSNGSGSPEADTGKIQNKVELLLDVYQSSLQSHLTLKLGVADLFRALQELGKNIIIVTEGPADAQKWTVEMLGLEHYVDILITTNELGKSKVDGLFGAVLDKYGIDAGDIVYFGDNEVRDVQAARESGVLSILYDERRDRALDDLDNLRIDSWVILRKTLLGAGIE
ncbi:hypothetical protein N7466_009529 [Penicillium verhagenii]|uniref:uncharacterized protein n=1 Tax=Penicillium verhagenii TaxID=1562060 RepID=UPI002545434A|nr:uncharacterized protein N7466_009529 [Penicillium verhagenii]KAJ5921203.1 hypothetical protein N7466_009529 [Penicillium verhagenii]